MIYEELRLGSFESPSRPSPYGTSNVLSDFHEVTGVSDWLLEQRGRPRWSK